MEQEQPTANATMHNQQSWVVITRPIQGWDVEDCIVSESPAHPPLLGDERMGFRRNTSRVQEVETMDTIETLSRRVHNANAYFRRRAAEVLDDEQAMKYLENLYRQVVVDIPSSDMSPEDLALAKIAAANFCEIGVNAISITLSGRRFVESIGQ